MLQNPWSKDDLLLSCLYEPLSKLPVSPLITPIVVHYITPDRSPFKEFRLLLMCQYLGGDVGCGLANVPRQELRVDKIEFLQALNRYQHDFGVYLRYLIQ